jgi:Predicted RNA-binding protein containing a PIN domain
MPILVDGHNLIGQIPGLRLDDPEDEYKLVLLLRRYATRKKGRRIVVVFDHGIYGHPSNLNGYGVECVFAKSPKDADAELMRRMNKIRHVKEWVLVSSDRAVTGVARGNGIKVRSSHEFGRKLLIRSTAMPKIEEKDIDRKLSHREIEEWLRFFGIDPENVEDQMDDDDDDEQMNLMWMF